MSLIFYRQCFETTPCFDIVSTVYPVGADLSYTIRVQPEITRACLTTKQIFLELWLSFYHYSYLEIKKKGGKNLLV